MGIIQSADYEKAILPVIQKEFGFPNGFVNLTTDGDMCFSFYIPTMELRLNEKDAMNEVASRLDTLRAALKSGSWYQDLLKSKAEALAKADMREQELRDKIEELTTEVVKYRGYVELYKELHHAK